MNSKPLRDFNDIVKDSGGVMPPFYLARLIWACLRSVFGKKEGP